MRDRQAQTCPRSPFRGGQLLKLAEDPVQIFLLYSTALVGNAASNPAAVGGKVDTDLAFSRRELDGIGQQIRDHLLFGLRRLLCEEVQRRIRGSA